MQRGRAGGGQGLLRKDLANDEEGARRGMVGRVFGLISFALFASLAPTVCGAQAGPGNWKSECKTSRMTDKVECSLSAEVRAGAANAHLHNLVLFV
jgi:hypothetical protein